jgi:hypothetical protein
MPDAMDRVQQHVEDSASDALRRHADRPRTQGLMHCEVADCREPIHPKRTALGARLCIECQQEAEARDAHLSVWRRGR